MGASLSKESGDDLDVAVQEGFAAPAREGSDSTKKSLSAVFDLDSVTSPVRSDDSSKLSSGDGDSDVLSDFQDMAVCAGTPVDLRPDVVGAMQQKLVGELRHTLHSYDERFLARLRERLRLLASLVAPSPDDNRASRSRSKTSAAATANAASERDEREDADEPAPKEVAPTTRNLEPPLTSSYEVRFGVELLHSLLSFIVTSDNLQDIAQRRLILEQVSQLVAHMNPLSLMERAGALPTALTSAVVDRLREFLLQMTLPAGPAAEVTIRDLAAYAHQFSLSMTSLARVASARGRASDLLCVIYVLVQAALSADREGAPKKRNVQSFEAVAANALTVSPSITQKKLALRKELDKAQKMRILPGKDKCGGKGKTGPPLVGDPKLPGSSSSTITTNTTNGGASSNDGSQHATGQLLRQVWASKAQLDHEDVVALAKQLRNAEAYDAMSFDHRGVKKAPTAAGCSEVWSCGQNSYGELAHGDSIARATYKRVDCLQGKDVVQIAAGNEHTVVLAASGAVYTSGYNDNGQCGHGTLHGVGKLKQISKLESSPAAQIHAYNGCEHTLVVLKDGRLVSFGYNYRGQLGHGNTASLAVPRIVRGLEARQVILVSCSYHHTVVACKELEVYSFGRNDFGQLGHGDAVDKKSPEIVPTLSGETIVSVACGQYHTCVARRDGQIFSCGKNDYGQLGFTALESVSKMTCMTSRPIGMANVTTLRCGYYHTIALTELGRVYGFGRNDYGQLGLGHATQRVYGPKLIESIEHKPITYVAAGCYHTVLVGDNGVLYVCGRNNHGQIGTGDTIDLHSPFAIDRFLGKNVVSVAAGFYHTVVLTRDADSNFASRNLQIDEPPFSAASVLKKTLPHLTLTFDDKSGEDADQYSEECALSPSSDTTAHKSPFHLNGGGLRNCEIAMFILAQMDRLISAGFPAAKVATSPTRASRTQQYELGTTHFADDASGGFNQRLYCIDPSPDTFELLLSLLISVYLNEPPESSASSTASYDGAVDQKEASPANDNDSMGEDHTTSRLCDGKPRPALTSFEHQYMLVALLRILRVNVEYLLYLEHTSRGEEKYATDISSIAVCQGEHISMPHAALYEQFQSDAMLDSRTSQNRNVKSRQPNSRIWDALCGLQHQLVLILQAPAMSGAGSQDVQQEAAAVLMVGIDLFYPCQIHQAQLICELLAVEFGVSRPSPRDATSSLSENGRTPAKRQLLHRLLSRISTDEVSSRLVPCDMRKNEEQHRSPAALCTSRHVEKTFLMLSETLVKCIVLATTPAAASPTTTPLSRGGSSFFAAASDAVCTQDLLRHALLALQQHLFSSASASAMASALSVPTHPHQSHPEVKDCGSAAVVAACAEIRYQAAQVPKSIRCLADYAEMIIGYSLDFVTGGKQTVASSLDLDAPHAYLNLSAPKDTHVLQHLQESVIGLILPPLIIGLLPFAYQPPLSQRLLKHLVHLLKMFDSTLQQMFALKAAPDDSKGDGMTPGQIQMLQLQVKKNQSYDFHKLAWLQDLTKTTAILVGRFTGAIVAGGVWVGSEDDIPQREPVCQRWLVSTLLAGGLERSCVAIIEHQGILPEDAISVRDVDLALTQEGHTYACWQDVTGDKTMLDWMSQWLRQAYCAGDRSYTIVAQQIARSTDSKLVTDFENAVLAVLLKRNDLISQARLFATKRRAATASSIHLDPPRRFLALWGVVARSTMWLWTCRSRLRATANSDAVDSFMARAISSARTLLVFADQNSGETRVLGQVQTLLGATTASRASNATLWRRSLSRLRSMLRWKRLYGTTVESSDVRSLFKSMHDKRLLECTTEVSDFISDVADPKHIPTGGENNLTEEEQKECTKRLPITQLIVSVVRNYHRAYWRRSGLHMFHGLLRSLETQSSQASALYCLTRLQNHKHLQGHFLHYLPATGMDLRRSLEESHEELCREITNIIHCISHRNGYIRNESTGSPTLLGAAEAQLLLVALNALGWNYTRADWRYLQNLDIVKELHGVIENLEVASSSLYRANGRIGEYGTQMRSIIAKPLAGGSHGVVPYSTDLSQAKQCLRASWNLLRLLMQSIVSTESSLGGHASPAVRLVHIPSHSWFDALKPIYEVFYAIAKRALIKLDAGRGGDSAEVTEEPDLIEVGFHATVGATRNSPGDFDVPSSETRGGGGSRDQQRRCQEIISMPVRFSNSETGIHIPSDRMISNSEGSDFSITFWVCVTENANGHHRVILARGTTRNWLVVLLRDVDLRLEVGLVSGLSRTMSDRVIAKGALTVNRWTHVGLVSEGTKLKLYVDGTLDQKSNCDVACASGQQVYLGKVPDGILHLDGVRGGLDGSIAKLRYYTRALSPIHVRIICDQGAPQGAQTNDRWCSQICALLFLSSKARSTQSLLRDPKWQELLFNMLLFGTSRIQLAITRLLRVLLPEVAPEDLANLCVRSDWFQHSGKSPGSRRSPEIVSLVDTIPGPRSQTFVRTLLLISGLAMWRTEHLPEFTSTPPSSTFELANLTGAPGAPVKEQKPSLSMLLPCNLLRCYTPGGKTPPLQDKALSISAENLNDISVLAAEITALLQSVCMNEHWRQILHEAAKSILRDQTEGSHGEIGIVMKIAVLSVLGGFSDYLRPGAHALMTKTNTRVCVVSLDDALSLAHVIADPTHGLPAVASAAPQQENRWKGRLPKVVRVSTNELKFFQQQALSSRDGMIRDDDFLAGSVITHILDSFENCAEFCLRAKRYNLQRVKATVSAANLQDHQEDTVVLLLQQRCLVCCLKVVNLMCGRQKWISLLAQREGLFVRILDLAKLVDPLARFDDIAQLEKRTISLRKRLFQVRSLSSSHDIQPSSPNDSEPRRGEVADFIASADSIRQFSGYDISVEMCFRALNENQHNAAEAGVWVADNIDMISALDQVAGRVDRSPSHQGGPFTSWCVEKGVVDEENEESATVFDEEYFFARSIAVKHSPRGVAGRPFVADAYWQQQAGLDACTLKNTELLGACCNAELSLAILYARTTLLHVLNAGSQQLILPDLLGSPQTIKSLLKLFVFRGSQFPDLTQTKEGGLVVNAADGETGNSASLILGIFHRLIWQAVRNGTSCDQSSSSSASDLLAHCTLVMETAASARELQTTPWLHRDMKCSDAEAIVRPNVELADWLLSGLQKHGVSEAFGPKVFIQLMRCFPCANLTLRYVVAKALIRILRTWVSALEGHRPLDARSSTTEEPPKEKEGEERRRNMLVTAGGVVPPSQSFLEFVFDESGILPHLRRLHQRRLSRERSEKRLCFSPYLNTFSELLVLLADLEWSHIRLKSPPRSERTARPENDVHLCSPSLVEAMARSLHVEWPNATSKEKQNTSWPCMYELQVADLIAGMDGDVAQFRTVYRGSRRDAVVHGLVPLRNYTLRIRATMLFADDYDGDASIETTGPSVQLRTLSGPVFGFDRGSRGESINVSDDGLVATYTGNEAWSMILGDEPLVAGCNQWEVRIDESPTSCIFVGVATRFADTTTFLGGDEHSWGYIGDRALYHKRMKVKVYGERYGMGDVIGVTLDMNHGMLSFSKNGFDLGIAFDGLAGELFPAIAFYNRGQQVSIKTSSYRCPGIGDVIPRLQKRYFGIDELQEYTLLMRSLYGSREKPGRVPATWRQRAFVWYRAWHAGITARHPTFTGADIFVDTSKDACRHFGTAEGDVVQISRGRARVIGVASGLLWFYLEGQDRAWFLTPSEVQRLRALGYLKKVSTSRLDEESSSSGGKFPPPLTQKEFDECCALTSWTREADVLIVDLINEATARKSGSASPWNLPPSELIEALHHKPRAYDLVTAASSSSPSTMSTDEVFLCRASVLYTLNEHVKAAFPFVGGTVDDDEFRRSERVWPVTTKEISGHLHPPQSCFSFAEEAQQQQDLLNALLQNHHHFRAEEKSVSLRECFHSLVGVARRLIFTPTKQELFHIFLRRTMTQAKQVEDDYDYPEDLPQVSLNRLTTMASRSRGEPDTKLAQSMFGQLCDRLHFLEPRLLRMGYTHPMDDAQERTFKVKFEGEGVDDYGGPFREIFVQVPLELQDVEGTRCKLPLFLPIEDSTKFVPVPRSPCRAHREMYAFIGKLIGVSLRCKVTMQFNFPSRIWKALLNQALDLDDIAAMAQDVLTEVGHALDEIADRSAETTGLFWTTTLSDGTEIDLRPRGHSQLVSVSETEEYIRVAIAARLNENYEALIAMRAGFESIIPAPVLQVYTGAELEKLVCGVQSVDLDLLRRNTDYDDDVHPDDPHIQYFWEALHSFDEHDRSAFLRFVWARTRLPASQMDFHQKFKIQSAVGDGPARDPDSYLPKCHTCFFSINLPRYSSVEIMAARLKFAIHNCVEMDADFRLADNELVRWFDVD